MKKFVFVLLLVSFFACGKGYRMAKITHGETEKTVDVCWGDTAIRDTVFTVPIAIPDSIILKNLRVIEDSLRREKEIRDKAVADSLYVLFQQDSTNFRRITLLINGGYNGWDDRYKRWLIAREAILNHKDSTE